MTTGLVGQILRFVGVGGVATLVHATVALVASALFNLTPHLANLAGFFCAVLVSYFGHGILTFETELKHRFHAPRFVVASAMALVLSALLTQIITVWLGKPMLLSMIAMTLVVPLCSFLLYRFWVFSGRHCTGP